MTSGINSERLKLVRDSADAWAKELIELNHRNTLVNFKRPKTASLDLTHCEPAALSGLLAGNKTGLRALFGTEERHREACNRARSVHRKIIAFREEQGVEVGQIACGLARTLRTKSTGVRPALPLRAPLLLRPVTIHPRTAAESDFTVQAGDKIELNPVLLHALQREYGVDLNIDELTGKINEIVAELINVSEQVDQAFRVLTELSRQQGTELELEPAVVIGLFNYQKLPMVRDLESATELLADHDLIAAIAGHEGAADEVRASATGFTPPPVDGIKPTDEYLVQDANFSQHQAVETALAGQHLLIEGPPGTGKSQTIANIIVGAAAQGKKVLFVAEKRAAIEAVTSRLAEVDLVDLVLDLHQTTINKRHVAQQLSESLSRVTQEPPVDVTDVHRRIADRREKLARYAHELHEPRAPWGRSAYNVREELLRLGEEYRTQCAFRGDQLRDLDEHTASAVEDDLQEFVEQGGFRVLRGESPWSQAEVQDEDIERVLVELDELAGDTLHRSTDHMHRLVAQVGLPVPQEIAGWQRVLGLLDDVAASVEQFGPEIFGEHLDLMHYATAPRAERTGSPQQLTWRQRRAVVKQVRLMCRSGASKKTQLHIGLGNAVRQRNQWWELGGQGARPAHVVGLDEMMLDYQRLRQQLAAVALSARLDDLETQPTPQVEATLEQLRADKEMLFKLPTINELRRRFAALGLTALLAELAERDVTARQACLMFRHTWLRCLDDEFKVRSQVLRTFVAEQQDRLVEEFQSADREHQAATVRRVRRRVAVAVRQARDDYPDEAKLLRKEASKSRKHLPLRKLVEQAAHVLLTLRPCWAMSPLVVSQTLPATRLFDLVIFDEASQIKPHDAITSIMRGDRLVVAGDEKQLPPSSWFDRQFSEDAEDDDEDTIDLRDYRSILTSLRSVIPHHRRLRWHYRSQDERLIAFSNVEIYDHDLVTFPGAWQESPMRLEVVNGVASPGQDGLPAEEARRVVELVIEHAERRPEESLGVITLGMKHRDRVDQKIKEALRDRRDLDEFFAQDAGPNRRFFVKNIETVQGDERDAIILSIGVAKKANGEVPRTGFGPLNHEGGPQRLNVAVSRAKRRMTVVSSFPSSALAPSGNVNGTELLRRFLEMIERDVDPSDVGRTTGTELNGFERDIAQRLAAQGIKGYPQWGVSRYRIDFALAHPDVDGKMVLAVEADGDRYHRAESTRDRDRLRQEHLERLGWRFHRVWASAWFADPETEIQKITSAWRVAVVESAPRPNPRVQPPPATTSARLGLGPLEQPNPPEQPVGGHGVDREPRPDVPAGLSIDDYTDQQLIALCLWLIGDGMALDREERLTQAMRELGFKRRGRKITERLTRVVEIAQHLADKEEG